MATQTDYNRVQNGRLTWR